MRVRHQQLSTLEAETSALVERKIVSDQKFIPPRQYKHSPRRRSRSKHHLGLSALVHSTYKALCRAIASCNGCCDWSVAKLSAYVGVSDRQFQRDVKVLVARGLIEKIMRRGKAYGNETNLWKRVKLGSTPPGDKTSLQRQVLLNASSTSAIAPVLPRAREGASEFTPATGSPNEPLSPANPPAQAKIPARMPKKPGSGWNRRGQSVYRQPNPAQKAARRVMEALGVSPGMWRSRDAIVTALRQWLHENPGREGLEAAGDALLSIWADYQQAVQSGLLWREYAWGPCTFFGQGYWQHRDTWGWARRNEAEERMRADNFTQSGRELTSEEYAELEARQRDAEAHEAAGERWSILQNAWVPA